MSVESIFLDLVKLSSPSKEENLVSEYIKKYLSKYPELQIEEDNTGEIIGGNSNNLIVTLFGKKRHILFDAHMDTVDPCEKVNPQINGDFITSDGTSVLGADDKSGIALMLELIDYLISEKIPHPTITFLFTVCEEKSLLGAKNLNSKYLENIDFAYILDGEGPIGTAIVKTPHGCKGNLKIIGKEAHAGVCPEEGINAFVLASEATSKLTMGRIDQDTTCNIGVAQGGTATNVVMGELNLQFEARSYEREKLEQLIEKVKLAFSETCLKHGGKFEESLRYGTPGYKLEEDSDILQPFKNACLKANVLCQGVSCGGGSNANVYEMRGTRAINLSTNMQNIHSVNEKIAIKDLEKMFDVLKNLVQEFC